MWNNKIYSQYDDKKNSCAKRLNWLSQPRYVSYEMTVTMQRSDWSQTYFL